jgi:AraC-like DNA-binding protein
MSEIKQVGIKIYGVIIFVLFPFIVILAAFLVYYKSPLNLLENRSENSSGIRSIIFDDSNEKGNSVCRLISKMDGVRFSYTLKEGIQYPFSGIVFQKNDRFMDFSSYDIVKVKMKASKGKRIPLVIHTFIDGYTAPEVFNTLGNNQAIINVDTIFRESEVKIAELKTPDWWYTLNKKTENNFGEVNYKKVRDLSIINCMGIDKGIEDVVEIRELSIHVDMIPFYKYTGLFILIYSATGILIIANNRKRKSEKKLEKAPELSFVYHKTETINHFEREEKAVFQYITKNYQNPDLTITEVQSETGISEQKISAMIKNKTQKNFKQFLNKLRLTEAKRLLRETDLQISEIAFSVGYGNISHFNRVFKEAEECSPNDYRKKALNTISE